MRGVETRIQEIRHKIFTEVARMAYHTEWPVKERMEALPYKIIPGEKGNFRNDVFLERAIVGERLRLAMGLPYRSAAEANSCLSAKKLWKTFTIEAVKMLRHSTSASIRTVTFSREKG